MGPASGVAPEAWVAPAEGVAPQAEVAREARKVICGTLLLHISTLHISSTTTARARRKSS